PANPSKWAVRDLYMTHLAVSDAKGQRYRYAEKLSRGGPGLAGAYTDKYFVWNDDWTAGMETGSREPAAGSRQPGVGNREPGPGGREPAAGTRPHRLHAIGDQAGIDLTLDEGKPPAINGINGISQKGAQVGNASHYYSLTRMPTSGTITVDGETFTVT